MNNVSKYAAPDNPKDDYNERAERRGDSGKRSTPRTTK
jgi:hypothetical protein